MKNIIIYTDGGCLKNPDGPGGYGVVLLYDNNGSTYKKELSGGFNNTTNNRMELMAVIAGLEALKTKCSVKIHSDSQYIVNAINQKWVEKWRNNCWYKDKKHKEKAKNIDLWKKILLLIEKHEVEFIWVKGHAGNYYNEICDQLANSAMKKHDLPDDVREEE
jgi:ribonuclease HI